LPEVLSAQVLGVRKFGANAIARIVLGLLDGGPADWLDAKAHEP